MSLKHFFTTVTLTAITALAQALPTSLITHNLTNLESNAFVTGTIPSPIPSKANTTTIVPWAVVQMACFKRSINDECPATIKMASNTANPIVIGNVVMNLKTGLITPTHLTANGYTLTVNGPAEATLTKN